MIRGEFGARVEVDNEACSVETAHLFPALDHIDVAVAVEEWRSCESGGGEGSKNERR